MHPAFQVHRLNESGLEKASKIARLYDDLVAELSIMGLGGSREYALAVTKLEESCFFAKKGMANQPVNQQ